MEYSKRRRTTKREAFLQKMDEVTPWKEWVDIVRPYYPDGKRGRRPQEIERMLRMLMLQVWFNLSDEGVEDAIYDSYSMRSFMGIDFNNEQAPDATTLCNFRKLLNENGLQEKMFSQVNEVLENEHKAVRGGTIVDATIIEASSSKKNENKSTDPEMHSTRKGTKWFFGMRLHVGVDPLFGHAHSIVCTAANEAECKIAARLLRPDDKVVYGDAGYLKMERYVYDKVEREYRINRQIGTFKLHYGDSLAWQIEKELEKRKSSIRCKVEYIFHIIKNIFKWKKTKYKGIHKNQCYAYLAVASANLYMLVTGGKKRCKLI